MITETNRRMFCGSALLFAASPTVTFIAAQAPDPIPGLCARYLALEPILDDLWARRDNAYDIAVSLIGECDTSSHGANVAWWDAYSQTEASRLDGEWQRLADGQCRIMEQIIDQRATTLLGVVAKLALWQETHEDDSEDGAFLIASVIEDCEVLS